ncbi:TM2 domain-containing protein [Erysipelothrix inopinata]|nr:TM2 domain-containing protein [Erysipelothrix inopinata]
MTESNDTMRDLREREVRMFLMNNGKYFDNAQIPFVHNRLMGMTDHQFLFAMSMQFKDPTMMLIVSIFFGEFGLDRFLMGDIGMGLLKLVTGGLCGLLWLIDIFQIQGRVRDYNLNQLLMI